MKFSIRAKPREITVHIRSVGCVFRCYIVVTCGRWYGRAYVKSVHIRNDRVVVATLPVAASKRGIKNVRNQEPWNSPAWVTHLVSYTFFLYKQSNSVLHKLPYEICKIRSRTAFCAAATEFLRNVDVPSDANAPRPNRSAHD